MTPQVRHWIMGVFGMIVTAVIVIGFHIRMGWIA